jgi:hypothetical protein
MRLTHKNMKGAKAIGMTFVLQSSCLASVCAMLHIQCASFRCLSCGLIKKYLKDPDAIVDPNESVLISREHAETRALEAFNSVLEHGPKIELDHHLVYHTRNFVSAAKFTHADGPSRL